MTTKYYDIIIVGTGLSGLYSAYNIKKMFPKINLLVLESNQREYIGGRIGNYNFYGEQIVIGAGHSHSGRPGQFFLPIFFLKLIASLPSTSESHSKSPKQQSSCANALDTESINRQSTTPNTFFFMFFTPFLDI